MPQFDITHQYFHEIESFLCWERTGYIDKASSLPSHEPTNKKSIGERLPEPLSKQALALRCDTLVQQTKQTRVLPSFSRARLQVERSAGSSVQLHVRGEVNGEQPVAAKTGLVR